MVSSCLGAATASIAAAILLGVGMPAMAAPTASGAFGLKASFTVDGVTTGIGPLDALSGSAPPGYAKSATIGPIQKLIHIAPGKTPIPVMALNVSSIRTHVASSGFQIDSASAEGDATVKGLDLSLTLDPPPPGGPFPQPFLRVTIGKIVSTASMSQVFPQVPAATSTATFSDLAISGSLIGDQPISLSGDVPNNTVIFQSPTVTVTLNGKFLAGLITCDPKCTFKPVTLSASALDIALSGARLDGKAVSGDIVIGASQVGESLAVPLVAAPSK